MKRVWAAVAVLAVLVALCILGLVTTVTAADEMLRRTEQIETCLRQSQYEEAAALTEDAIDQWERKSRILCTFFSHLQLETADKEWDALRASLEAKEYGRGREHCGQLTLFWNHLRKVDFPYWENVL